MLTDTALAVDFEYLEDVVLPSTSAFPISTNINQMNVSNNNNNNDNNGGGNILGEKKK